MCGIALIISGIKIDLSLLIPRYVGRSPQSSYLSLFSVEDIKTALQRRGPDSLGANTINLYSKVSDDERKDYIVQSFIQKEGANGYGCGSELRGELHLIGATLQLRGVNPVVQPLTDAFNNVLVYNGEIFRGIPFSSNSNDTEILMQSLERCCSCTTHEVSRGQNSVPDLLSRIRGPWALIYWQDSSKTLWFGRDALGRRSLLVHWPTIDDPRLLLSSVSPLSSNQQHYEIDGENGHTELSFWEELPCGVYSISMSPLKTDGYITGEVKKHEWTDSEIKEMIAWERTSIEPKSEDLSISEGNFQVVQGVPSTFSSELGSVHGAPLGLSHKVLVALKESIKRRTTLNRIYQDPERSRRQDKYVPVAVLFSGGLDSMIIAALLHQSIDSEYEIDLLNVSFDGDSAPDRISARGGLKELQKIAPSRKWNLVEIDADLSELTTETKHVMKLINPANTYMDLNIGIALWLAAGGDGWLYEEINGKERVKYKSEARILLVGSGADEQCAGYGRHRTKFRNKSWIGLHEEMKLDMQRIWKRNLGRDDRCISDNGKEARFPFLEEDVIRFLLDIPLWEIADLNQWSGVGDKKILREVARLLGLDEAAGLPKRAIQFGSRIARESNRKIFGSNRAANQACAGSVVIYKP